MRWRSLVALGALSLTAASEGITEPMIEEMRTAIRKEYLRKPELTFLEVQLVRESANKATGFVRVEVKGLGELMRPCTVTLAPDGVRFIALCQ